MDDMATKIGEILNDKQSMSQIMQLAQSLGFSGASNQAPPLPNNGYNNQSDNQGGGDLSSMLSGLLGNLSVPNNTSNNQQNTHGGADLSAMLSGLLSNLSMPNGNSNYIDDNSNMIIEDIPSNQSQGFPMPNFDIGMLMTIQKAMSSFNESNKNVDLLKALKPHLSDERQKKVNDAIRIMQLMNVLPLLKESGIFGFLGGDKNGR